MDIVFVFRIIYIGMSVRVTKERWAADFDANGNIFKNRPNCGHAANIRHVDDKGERLWDWVYKGYYVLQGDSGATKEGIRS